MQTYDRIQAAFPGGPAPAVVVVEADDVDRPRGRRGGPASCATQAIDDRADERPGRRQRQRPRQTVARGLDPDGRLGHRRHARSRRSTTLREDLIPGTLGQVDGVDAYVTGMTAGSEDFNEQMSSTRADRLRVRPRARVRAADGHVPLDRDRAEGDRAQPALRGRGLRRAGLGVPGRPPRVAAGLRVQRRDRLLAAAVPVRPPVRPLDGLPRVHHQPDPGGVRRRHEHRATRSPTGSSRRPASSPAPRW